MAKRVFLPWADDTVWWEWIWTNKTHSDWFRFVCFLVPQYFFFKSDVSGLLLSVYNDICRDKCVTTLPLCGHHEELHLQTATNWQVLFLSFDFLYLILMSTVQTELHISASHIKSGLQRRNMENNQLQLFQSVNPDLSSWMFSFGM